MYSFAGWKLNPVVGAVYSPEFYAGMKTYIHKLCILYFFFAVYVLHDNMHWTDRIMQMRDFPQRRTCGCADFHVFAEAAFEITARFHVPRLFARPNCTPFCSLV